MMSEPANPPEAKESSEAVAGAKTVEDNAA